MRILLVEDDEPLSAALSSSLRGANYVVDCVYRGKEALAMLTAEQTDIVILDLGLPDMDGLEVLRQIRQKVKDMPVIILTARDKVTDKILGLDAGADDYLPKPFDMDELFARLRVLERRLGTASTAMVKIGKVALNTQTLELTVAGEAVSLPRRELMLLKVLMENGGRIQPKQKLESRLYEWGDEVSSNTIEVHIHHLRKKLPENFIKTIRGVGYSIPVNGA
ncbi:response regulator [Alteromonas oceani]|jgi:two-component system OmpR family response regulator|uniref:Response regulator n=1 Tax=Alteromonas oceani TaxID=2071609 RepID=A0ABV7K3J9_9ALTE|nr:response regulator transcription factor [Alteromonas oceani]HAU93233.1 DNA-binding response regulator [Alteromonas sp.]HCA77635.1 DNA-binding response regulator [Alteromonas sp.]HCB08165.1 DNA-binding response regulator [Alteromonas sp.]HCL12730.1 DNA-binding response regulator [Alteromonas sp.]HCV16677.1 DNA-binding response regulator [Alteromonas sp.]|tara:strand:+ start:1604 stop:2269 length:666 start_codon:yes stop_codon:yes gene_type:complete